MPDRWWDQILHFNHSRTILLFHPDSPFSRGKNTIPKWITWPKAFKYLYTGCYFSNCPNFGRYIDVETGSTDSWIQCHDSHSQKLPPPHCPCPIWWSRNTTARLWCALLGWCHHARARTWRALSWKSCIFMRLTVARNHRIRRRGCCGLLRARSCRPPPWKWPSRQVSKPTHHFMSGLLYSCFFLIWIQSFLLNFLFSTPRQLRRLIFIHLWSSSMHLVVGILLDSPTLRHHGTKFINIGCRHIVGSLDILGQTSLTFFFTATPVQNVELRCRLLPFDLCIHLDVPNSLL